MEKPKKQCEPIAKNKYFWLFLVFGVVAIVLGVFLLPVWENVSVFWKAWGEKGVSAILFLMIVAYITLYLGGRFFRTENTTLRVVSLIELIALILIAFGCLLQQFGVFAFFGPCFVFGAIFWLRGFFNIVNAYLYRPNKKKPYPIWLVIVSVLMASAGTALMVRPFTGAGFIWIVSVGLLAAGVALVIYGFAAIPVKKAAEAKKK